MTDGLTFGRNKNARNAIPAMVCGTGCGRHDLWAGGGFSGGLWPSAPLRDLDANPRSLPSCRSGGSARSCCGTRSGCHARASTLRIRNASARLCAATVRATSGGEEVQNHEEALQGSKVEAGSNSRSVPAGNLRASSLPAGGLLSDALWPNHHCVSTQASLSFYSLPLGELKNGVVR